MAKKAKSRIHASQSTEPIKSGPVLDSLTVEWWPIDRPKPYAKNARKLSPRAIDVLVTSLKEFGWQQPIVVDLQDVIVVGHTRLMAARKLGMEQVPVHVAANLTPAQAKSYRIMDNRSSVETSWNFDLLSAELLDLKSLDVDLALTGFEPFEYNFASDGVLPGWEGMPEFHQDNQLAWKTVMVHFLTPEHRQEFSSLVGQPLTDKTKYIWYPPQERVDRSKICYSTDQEANPRYPVYVISKGRWESRLTSKALESIKVPYRIVVEPQEFEQYASVVDPAKILVLPFSNLGQGSIPARNWVWDHSIGEGHARHWILDDNIRTFYRLNNNLKVPVSSGVTFKAAEDYVDRFENVALAGMQYQWLAKQKQKLNPFVLNTRIYSCILIDNGLAHRWRGRYNEDTDLSLRVLKDGMCTVLFQAFLADKITTMAMKGGNTDELYQADGRRLMAESLRDQHPDVVTVVWKWNRWQHQVDYRPFKANKFIAKPGVAVPDEGDEFGMELVDLSVSA